MCCAAMAIAANAAAPNTSNRMPPAINAAAGTRTRIIGDLKDITVLK